MWIVGKEIQHPYDSTAQTVGTFASSVPQNNELLPSVYSGQSPPLLAPLYIRCHSPVGGRPIKHGMNHQVHSISILQPFNPFVATTSNHYEKPLWVLLFDMSWCCFQLNVRFQCFRKITFVFVHILFIHIFIHIWEKKQRKDHTRGLHCILWVALSALKMWNMQQKHFFPLAYV